MDYGRAITNTLTLWFKDGKILRLMGLQILVGAIFLLLLGGAIWLFFGDLMPQIMALSSGDAPSPAAISQFITAIVAKLVLFLIVVAPLLLLEMAISIYISVLMQARALEVLGFTPPQVTPMRALKYVLMNIWVMLMAITSWYSRKLFFLFLGIIFVLLFGIVMLILVPPIGAILLLLGVLACIPYLIVYIYNSIRLSVADAVYLSSEDGVFASVRKTWGLTQGKALEVFLAGLLLGICLIVVSFAISIPEVLIRTVLTLLTGSALVAIAFSSLYRVVLNPILSAMASFVAPSIYLELTNPAPSTIPSQQQTSPISTVPQPPAQNAQPVVPVRAQIRKPVAKKGAARKK